MTALVAILVLAAIPFLAVSALLKLAEQCLRRDPALEQMLVRARAAVEPLLWPRVVADLSKSFLELVARSRAAASG